MKQRGVAFFLLVLLSASASASDYTQALNRAKSMVGMLGPERKAAMAGAKTEHLQEVINTCNESIGNMPGGMGVVLELDENGQVTDRWLKHATSYERCFGAEMEVRLQYDPPIDPFLIAFDYGN